MIAFRCRIRFDATVVALALAAAALASPARGAIRSVPDEYVTIQDAIDACSPGDEVQIAGGRYKGPGNTVLELYDLEITIRGLAPGSTIIDGEGTGVGMRITGEQGRACRITDLTFENGAPEGVLVADSSPTFNNCRFVAASGAGVVCQRAAPLFRFCGFYDNHGPGLDVTGLRGGMGPSLENGCLIQGNLGEPDGGGIRCTSTSITIEQCTLRGNKTTGAGGGIYLLSTTALLSALLVEGNEAGTEGGGVYANSSTVSTSNLNRIVANRAHTGAGLYVRYGQLIFRGVIAGNLAAGDGGGIASDQAVLAIGSSSIARNGAARGGGVFVYEGRSAAMARTILWGNCSDGAERDAFVEAGSGLSLTCCDLDPGAIGGGGTVNIVEGVTEDPQFCAMGSCGDLPYNHADLYLASGSPCIAGPCGEQIGALEENCAETPVETRTWGAIRASFR